MTQLHTLQLQPREDWRQGKAGPAQLPVCSLLELVVWQCLDTYNQPIPCLSHSLFSASHHCVETV